jgi:hypothetical protein
MPNELPPVSGFSIVKNATIYDYPVEVALKSVLPLVEELHVNIGVSDDDTLERVRSIDDSRIRIHETVWPDPVGKETRDLGEETNRVLDYCRHDWALYIQADEVLHEEDLPAIRRSLARSARRDDVDGLAFDYLHFYGSPSWHITGRGAFRSEIRLVRRSSGAQAFAGAQGFRIDGRLPRAVSSGARVFHYGYVKSQEALTAKQELAKVWKGEDASSAGEWQFIRPAGLRPFRESHPALALAWIEGREWPYDPSSAAREPLTFKALRYRVSNLVEHATGWRPLEHRSFQLID